MGIPLRGALPLLVLLVAIIMCLTTFIPLYLSGEETGQEFSLLGREEVGSRIGAETLAFFTPFHHMVAGVQSLARFNAINDSSTPHQIIPKICDAYNKVNFSSYIGLESGIFIKCVSFSPGFYTAYVRNITYQNIFHLDDNFTVVGSSLNEPTNYDPRERPWYSQLKVKDGYTNIYLNLSETGNGTTTTTIGGPIYDSTGTTLLGVMASDVFPTDVVEYFSQVSVANTGHGMLVEEETLNVLGADIRIPGLGSAKVPLEDISTGLLSADAIAAAVRVMECTDLVCHTSYGDGRDKVSVEARSIDPSEALPFRVVILIPESDFLGTLWQRMDITIAIIIPVAVVILLLAVVAALALLTPLSNLTAAMEGMADFSNLDAESIHESRFTEVYTVQVTLKRVVVQMRELKKFIPQNVMMDTGWSDDEDDSGAGSASSLSKHPLLPSTASEEVTTHQGDQPDRGVRVSIDSTAAGSKDQDHGFHFSKGGGGGRVTDSPRPQPPAGGGSDTGSMAAASTSFRLNVNKLTKSVNTFTMKRCSVLIAELALEKLRNRLEIQDAVKFFTDVVIGSALLNKGVIEVLRPEILVITFSTVMHETHAVDTAIRIAQQTSRWAGLDLITVAVDSGEYLRGNCGSQDRFANVVFGPMMTTLRKLPSLVHVFKGTMLLLTEATALKAEVQGFTTFPVDVVHPQYMQVKGMPPLRLYDICPDEPQFAVAQCRAGFTALLEGNLDKADEVLAVDTGSVNPHCIRLRTRAKALRVESMSNAGTGADLQALARREIFPWQEKGDLAQFERAHHTEYLTFSERFLVADDGLGTMSSFLSGGSMKAGSSVKTMLKEAQDSIKAEREANAPVFVEPEEDANPMFSFFAVAPVPLLGDDDAGLEEVEAGVPASFVDDTQRSWHRSELVIGKGTFGAVYQGMSDQGVLTALKFLELKADTDLGDMNTEVEALTRLEHENVVQLISAAVTKKYLIFALEYVPGGSLVTMMEAYENQLPPNVVRKFGRDILQGLAYLHSENVVHCDIKPGNVLLAGDGTCKITDFGSAVLGHGTTSSLETLVGGRSYRGAGGSGNSGNIVHAGSVVAAAPEPSTTSNDAGLRGTLKYMAPEVAEGSSNPVAGSDVWSFGITLCELATGHLPWKHLTGRLGQMGFLQQIGAGEIHPQIPPCVVPNNPSRSIKVQSDSVGVPPALQALLARCWATSAADRPSAEELLSDPYFME